MTGWRAAMRIARREARRSRGRSLLVVLLIGLPVFGLSAAAVSYDTFQLTRSESTDRQIGAADAMVDWPVDGPVKQDPTNLGHRQVTAEMPPPKQASTEDVVARFPAGSRAIPLGQGTLSVRTVSGTADLPTLALDYPDPLAHGLLTAVDGRAPAAADEAVVSRDTAKRVGADIGGALRSADGTRSWLIVGLVEQPNRLRGQLIVFAPGSPDAPEVTWLLDTPGPLSWPDVLRLNEVGVVALSRAVLADPPVDPTADPPAFGLAILIGGVLVLEVVLLAGPAFAVGAHRRRRELGLVAAAGGTPAQLRRIVLADGLVLGLTAAVGGVVLGVLAAAAARPVVEWSLAGQRSGAFRVFPVALVVLAGTAVLAGLLAALVPAWSASRQPVVAALAGRYRRAGRRRRWAVVGAVALGAGAVVAWLGGSTANAVLVLVGLVIGEFGLVFCTPALIGLLARLGSRLPLAPRIALREAGRNRASAAPAVSAVLGAVAVSALLATWVASVDEGPATTFVPVGYATALADRNHPADDVSLAAVEAAARTSLPVTGVVTYSGVECPGGFCQTTAEVPADRRCPFADQLESDVPLSAEDQRTARHDPRCDLYAGSRSTSIAGVPHDIVLDPDALGTALDLDPDLLAAATATLRAGGALVADPRTVVDGHVTLAAQNASGSPPYRTATVPAMVVPADVASPPVVLSPGAVRALDLTSRPTGLIMATGRMPTEAEQDRFEASVDSGWQVAVEQAPDGVGDLTLLIFALAAGVITLGATAIATGLAAADRRADLATLGAVGASPRIRRLLSLSQAGLIAGIGSVLGLAAGLAATVASIAGTNRATADLWPAPIELELRVPWWNVVVSLVLVPLVAMLGAGLLSRSRLPIERRL